MPFREQMHELKAEVSVERERQDVHMHVQRRQQQMLEQVRQLAAQVSAACTECASAQVYR